MEHIGSELLTIVVLIAVIAWYGEKIKQAIENRNKKMNQETASFMKTVYLCHPYSNDPRGNEKRCLKILKGAKQVFPDVAIFAPQVYLPQYFDEATERKQAMRTCLALLNGCNEMWVDYTGLKITEGMADEIEVCKEQGINVLFFVMGENPGIGKGIMFIQGPEKGEAK